MVWWCITALCKLGAVCIPGTYQLKPKDIVYRCNAAGIKMIVSVADASIVNSIASVRKECETLETVAYTDGFSTEGCPSFDEELAAASEVFVREETNKATDPMLIYFSSGTSGMPKMALHDFTLPLGHIVTAKYWQHAQNNKIHMTQTDSGWAKFAWGKIYGQWICGSAIGAYDTDKFVPDMMLKAIQLIKPTTFCAPATIYRYLIKEDLSNARFDFIEHACMAGEPLNPEVFYQIEAKTGLKLHEGFGQSEGSVLLANFGWDEIKPGSTGKPAPLYNIKLLDENGQESSDGENGSICVTGTEKRHPIGLFKYYYRDEAATRSCWQNGIYNTNDVAWRDSDGYYWFVGRNDDVIKCSGYRIGPFEVESALLEHPSVLECAVTAAPDQMRGQVVKATIVLAKGFSSSPELTRELQNHVKKVTADRKSVV
jgi:acetyl-CoA synthetase